MAKKLSLLVILVAIAPAIGNADTLNWYRMEGNLNDSITSAAPDGVNGSYEFVSDTMNSTLPGGQANSTSVSSDASGFEAQYTIAPLSGTTPFTVECFYKSHDAAAIGTRIAYTYSGTGGLTWTLQTWTDGAGKTNFYWNVNGAGVWQNAYAPVDFKLDTWYHVAGTYDGKGNLELFVNGVSVAKASKAELVSAGKATALRIGMSWGEALTTYTDEVRISNTVLTPDQMLAPSPQR